MVSHRAAVYKAEEVQSQQTVWGPERLPALCLQFKVVLFKRFTYFTLKNLTTNYITKKDKEIAVGTQVHTW